MPLMRCMKFSATRSPTRMERAEPATTPSVCPASTRAPSAASQRRVRAGSTLRKTACATQTPASTPDALARNDAVACTPSGTLHTR